MKIKLVSLRPLSSRLWARIALCAFLLVGCADRAGLKTVEPASAPRLVRNPGVVLVDPASRRATIRAAAAEDLCAVQELRARSWPSPGALVARDGHATDTRLNPVAWFVMRAAAAGFGSDDAAARAAVGKALDRWAREEALLRPPPRDAVAFYAVNRFLLPIVVGWALVRDAPEIEPDARARIETWLARLAQRSQERLRSQRPQETSARNNHAYLAASAVMAWGALAGDDAAFSLGLRTFQQGLSDMRADGSLPLETARGARALWYQRHAVASLVVIAELAARQGYDLWSLELDGKSLHHAIAFLLDAIDDPSRVLAYAAENRNPGPSPDWRNQDLSFLVRRGHGRHYMAWVEAYLARFPERTEAHRLRQLLVRTGTHRPLIDELAGGNASCLLGPLDRPLS